MRITMEYVKNFDRWNGKKKELDLGQQSLLFQEREIWIAHVGINIGIEQNGNSQTFVRPVLIFRKFSRHHFIGIPLTSNEKPPEVSYLLENNVPFLRLKSWLIFSQIRVLDSKRLHRKLGRISSNVFGEIQKKSARTFIRASGAEWQ